MAKIEFGKGLKELQSKIQDSAQTVKRSAQEVKLPETIQLETVKHLAEKAADSAKKAAETVVDNTKKVGQSLENAVRQPRKTEAPADEPQRTVSTAVAIRVIYYLMAADGEISGSELEKFQELCRSLDPGSEAYQDALLASCRKELENVTELGGYRSALQAAVDRALQEPQPDQGPLITPELLVWDLLVLASSDGSYSPEEKELVSHIARKMAVDEAVFLELESSMLTAMDLEKEIHWIKTTDRPYLTIEAMVNELQNRRNVVLEGVKALIAG